MKFGLLYEIEVPRPWQTDSLYSGFWEAVEQVKVAEEAGFDSVWSAEHHCLDQLSVASAPEIWLSAVAQHTERIRIGHGVRLLPFKYNNPIRTAEMAAVLDIMSKGRLEFGTGSSASAVELEGFGIDPVEIRGQWDEALRMIPQMWIQDEFAWSSEHFEMPPRNVLPKPVQSPHPPLWMSGTQPDSAVLAGERGIGFMHFSMADPIGMDGQVKSYRDAIARANPVGAFVNEQFGALTTLFCGRDDTDATTRAGEAVCWYTHVVEAAEDSLTHLVEAADDSRANPGEDATHGGHEKRWAEEGKKERSLSELVERRSAIVGGPERCIESIEWYASQGVDKMLFVVQMGALAHDDVCDSLRRFGREVIPHFQR